MKNSIKFIAIILAVFGGAFMFHSFKTSKEHNFEVAKNMDIFNAVVKELDMFYVDTIDPNVTVKRAIDAMLYSLDPHTNYYPAEDQSELEQMIKGSYGGIGSVISYDPKKKHSMIAEPYEGMPAAEVGLKVGDVLLQIDTVSLKGKDNQKISEMLRGEVGTTFKLKVQRPGVAKPMTFDITRKSIELPTIPYYGLLSNNVGYIEFVSFSGTPAADFKKAFVDLKSQGAKSLIIDLRNNGGGLLDEAVDIVNYFVPKGKTIVTTKGKIPQASSTYITKNQPLDTEIPIVLLVGGSTASAAEILAGSLQDLDRGVVVGSKTFGKGLVQVPRPLPFGANMKLTSAKYYIPSGRCVQAIDYSHRSADGMVTRIPDSLMTIFHTSIGREVKDGAGILPDIEVTPEKLPNILFYLVTENIIFDYATDFAIKHKTIAPATEFALTEADYIEFKQLAKSRDFKYDQQSEKVLKSLKELAEFEGYMEGAKAEFEALEKKLSHNIDRDLDYFSKDIKEIISLEIIKRYYYQKGSTIERLKFDEDVRKAVKILESPVYKKVLSPAFKPLSIDSIATLN